MIHPPGPPWDAATAAAACSAIAWSGAAWRLHNRRYAADDPAGSLKSPGRYNTRDIPALYLSLQKHIALGEKSRHVDPGLVRLRGARFRFSTLAVTLQHVLLCCDMPICSRSSIGRSRSQLCRARRFDLSRPTTSQAFASAAFTLGVEGILVPSCTMFAGGNLIVFPAQLQPGSRIDVVGHEDPALFV